MDKKPKDEHLAVMKILEILKPMTRLTRQHVLLVVKDQADNAQVTVEDVDINGAKKNCNSHLKCHEINDAIQECMKLVEKQAEDDGLWFDAEGAPEAYLQAALRGLHQAVEDAWEKV